RAQIESGHFSDSGTVEERTLAKGGTNTGFDDAGLTIAPSQGPRHLTRWSARTVDNRGRIDSSPLTVNRRRLVIRRAGMWQARPRRRLTTTRSAPAPRSSSRPARRRRPRRHRAPKFSRPDTCGSAARSWRRAFLWGPEESAGRSARSTRSTRRIDAAVAQL